MKKMEECVRTIEMDGLLWGACEFFLKYATQSIVVEMFLLLFFISTNHFIFYFSQAGSTGLWNPQAAYLMCG